MHLAAGTIVCVFFWCAVPQAVAQASATGAGASPGRALIAEVVDRASALAREGDREGYRYFQTTEAKVIDRRGKLDEVRTTTYDVDYGTGERRVTALLVNGLPASVAELRAELEKERSRYRQTAADGRCDCPLPFQTGGPISNRGSISYHRRL